MFLNIMKQFALLVAVLLFTGCASHKNFADTDQTATIREEWIREGMTVWRGTRISAIGNLEFGMGRYEAGSSFTVDAGRKKIKAWSNANRGNAQGLYWQTDPVELEAELKPNATYQVVGIYGETSVRFRLIDSASLEVLAESAEAPIFRRTLPNAVVTPTTIPIFIPVTKSR